ncbi:MAG: RluA family pseudouridine synthase [Bacteroidales bacterium]|jgi:23S rRNA pseudouridine1911/1915/1917 synthase|nr:RluA family pseudouridine synthase [Bacteroidales bacterium]MBQ1938145.1 RluA family pseudouridine synthase [Bacteroidales bacterium]
MTVFEEDIDFEEQNDQLEDNEGASFEHFRFEIDKGQAPIRVDKFLATHMEHCSRHRIQLAIKNSYVKVGEKTVKANYVIRPGDVVSFVMPYQRRGLEILPENIPLNIVYEDDDVLVLNKEAGMVVHPGHGHYSGTLVNALAHHLGLTQGADAEDERMGVLVHRIDKDTSGLLVVAKNEAAQLNLARQFFVHSIERCYVAVVWGNIKEDEGTIEGNIGRDPSDRLRFKVFPDGEYGKTAITHYKVLERFGFVTVVECRLETGRTHQIRVHFNHIGHPLFNDERYDGSEIRQGTIYAKYKQFIENCFKILPRQALHAKTLGFQHPTKGEWMRFDSQIPAEMEALIEKWRNYTKNLILE